ncbi:MAG: sigma-70 family RNA polymerase sigma factor [Actinomycetota bacterium]|nr:sigma-70 family RNA polymerase sigma factor [Actinomycetota bacterium]
MTVLPPFQAVLDEHRADVYRYLAASVGPADADDCFQETCLAALRAYPRLRHADHLRAWLFRIAQRKAVDVHRARTRGELPSDDLPERGVDDAAPDCQGGLFEQVRLLPDKQRAAVVLRCVLDAPYAELARVLDCSEPAARRSVHEGLTKLREGADLWTTSSTS